MYGEPFLKVADALRLEDMKRGAESGEYLILQASTDENGVMDVEFACLYASDLVEMGMLYEKVSGGLHEPFRFTVKLVEPKSKKWAVDMIRKASDPAWRLRRRQTI